MGSGLRFAIHPSNHIVIYNYDGAGRLADNGSNLAFSGNLGDGVTRTYAKGTSYDAGSRMTRELFGTDTLLYHNQHYNVRGQLYDTRVGSGTDGNGSEWTWNRGALQMYYEPSYTLGASGSNNNGNILMTAQHLPNNDQASSEVVDYQQYSYDSLNRLTSVLETSQPSPGNWTTPYQQSYLYDRWGNRTIDQGNTWVRASPSPTLELTQ